MLRNSLALCLLGSLASAQGVAFVTFGPGVRVTDIVTLSGGGIVATGYDALAGQAFLWTPVGGQQYIGGVDPSGGFQKLSADGTVVGSTLAGGVRAGRWTAANGWSPVLGLGGQMSGNETTFYALSGNGQVVVGLGWTIGLIGHAFRAENGATIDLTPPWNNNPSRANAVNYDGGIIAGWRDQGVRQGVVWIGGTMQSMTYTPAGGAPQRLGEALGMNQAGDHVVGYNNFDAASNTNGWLWTRATNTTVLLPNLPGFGAPLVGDVVADGSIAVGSSGGLPFGRNAIVWTNGVPQNAKDWLAGLGVPAASQYTQLGNVIACSEDGYAFCGYGAGANFGEPDGWIAYFPQALSVGTAFCAGDGLGTACPCGNNGLAERGCANSVNPDGARLRGTGTASLAADTVGVYGDGMPNSNALYFQGTTRTAGGAGAVFGDGLRCAGGTIVRLGTKTNAAGASRYPGSGDQSVSVRGLVTAPGTRTYQAWYRNAAAYCTASTFNLTNGLEVVWAP